MATKKLNSRKAHASTKRGRKNTKKRNALLSKKRVRREIQTTKPATYVEPVIDREREAALLESAIKEPC